MSALVTLAGADVHRGRIHMPQRGWWWAEIDSDSQTAPTGRVSIAAAGGFTLTGFVVRSGVYLDTARSHIVGGAGGLTKIISPAAFQNALVRDVLNAVLGGVGESLSSTIPASVLATLLASWTLTASTAARALDSLTFAAGAQTWRVLGDGTIWLGNETWPSQSLPASSDVLDIHPTGPRFEIGCATPALMPGVFLTDVGSNVLAVDHFITPERVRTWAWGATTAEV